MLRNIDFPAHTPLNGLVDFMVKEGYASTESVLGAQGSYEDFKTQISYSIGNYTQEVKDAVPGYDEFVTECKKLTKGIEGERNVSLNVPGINQFPTPALVVTFSTGLSDKGRPYASVKVTLDGFGSTVAEIVYAGEFFYTGTLLKFKSELLKDYDAKSEYPYILTALAVGCAEDPRVLPTYLLGYWFAGNLLIAADAL